MKNIHRIVLCEMNFKVFHAEIIMQKRMFIER